ncbi:MAG: TolC family protein [Bacteroidales bacterium]|nr:TolC family protein [Bacteroidales bacterium]
MKKKAPYFPVGVRNILKKKTVCTGFLLLMLFMAAPILKGQNFLQEYVDSARVNSPAVVQLKRQIQILELEKKSIKATYKAPKGYLSSEVDLTPYFNNNGELFTSNPSSQAYGYDVAIANGGLYSALMNVDVPLFVNKTTDNALNWQEQQINALKIQLKNSDFTLQQQVAGLFYDALGAQLAYHTQKETVKLEAHEVNLLEVLTRKGLYKIVDFELLKTNLSSDSIKLKDMAIAYRLQLMQLKSSCGISDSSLNELQMENLQLSSPEEKTSAFLMPYTNDSLTAIAENRLFNNRYEPNVTFYSNAGLNAVQLPGIQHNLGLGLGLRLTYTLFDGRQKQVNKAQSLIRIDQASQLKDLKSKDIQLKRAQLLKAIAEAKKNLQEQGKLKEQYQNLISLYKAEVQKGQVSVTAFLMALRNYNDMKLSYGLQQISLNKLINQYNYWNH